MTKSFTAAAVLSLRDGGKLRLDDRVSSWVPELEHLIYPSADAAGDYDTSSAHHVGRLAARRPMGRPSALP